MIRSFFKLLKNDSATIEAERHAALAQRAYEAADALEVDLRTAGEASRAAAIALRLAEFRRDALVHAAELRMFVAVVLAIEPAFRAALASSDRFEEQHRRAFGVSSGLDVSTGLDAGGRLARLLSIGVLEAVGPMYANKIGKHFDKSPRTTAIADPIDELRRVRG